MAVVAVLDQIEVWIDEIPLRTGPQRFGNAAFRDWGARLLDVGLILDSCFICVTLTIN